MVELIEQGRMGVGELIDAVGRRGIDAVLELSARQGAEVPQQGAEGRHRPLRITARSRVPEGTEAEGEQAAAADERPGVPVAIPSYEAIQKARSDRILEILLNVNGVSTRRYERVHPEMIAGWLEETPQPLSTRRPGRVLHAQRGWKFRVRCIAVWPPVTSWTTHTGC
ncbi:MAG TPA: hypothetical protein VNJ09_09745 [Chthonomonadales bacterium]|nr:hypothetical protein [Chthonomonadales bacterium]